MTQAAALPRVTVICIFFNAQRFLGDAIASVLEQTYQNFELLLVDDGSDDGSRNIAEQFAASHPDKIKCLAHPERANRGMSASRNLGLSSARGELVAMIDSDDVWVVQKLEQQVQLLDQYPGVGMVCGSVNYWRSWSGGSDRILATGGWQDFVSGPPDTLLKLYPLGRAHAPCPSDVMVRRSVIEEVGGFENQFTGLYEDQAFFAKVYLAVPVLFSAHVWTNYRQHPGSAVARSAATGEYLAFRRRYLDWFMAYLSRQDLEGISDLRQAIEYNRRRAQSPLQYWLGRFLDAIQDLQRPPP